MTAPTVTAPCFTVPGPVQIWLDSGASHAMELLGFTRGGVRLTEQAFFDELKSDASGGERGPVADFQFLGEMHMIDAELAQYSETIFAKALARSNVAVNRTPGMLMKCAGGQFRMVLISANFQRNYPYTFIVDPVDHGAVGFNAKYPRIGFTCLQDPAAVKGTNGAPADKSPWNTAITISAGGGGIDPAS